MTTCRYRMTLADLPILMPHTEAIGSKVAFSKRVAQASLEYEHCWESPCTRFKGPFIAHLLTKTNTVPQHHISGIPDTLPSEIQTLRPRVGSAVILSFEIHC